MEICVDSVLSAIHAERGGARRVELCANLMEGGTTPSAGMLSVIKQTVKIPVYVMIRPRGGDFLYSEEEIEVMRADIKQLKQLGADGIVLGALTCDGTVDIETCQELIDIARPLPVTFHRAIDMCRDLLQALDSIIKLGCERVLTSGGENSALEGAPAIRKMIEQGEDRIIVMPGGGISEKNIERIQEITGAREFHGSARVTLASEMKHRNGSVTMGAQLSPPEYSIKVTDPTRVKNMISLARGVSNIS